MSGPIEVDVVATECSGCENLTWYPGTAALIMVNPDGSHAGMVCGRCAYDGTFLQVLAVASAFCQDDTPTADDLSEEDIRP